MTKKEQKCPKRSCGRVWKYRGSKRKGATVRCPDCDGKVKLAAILTLVLLTGVGTAYAYEETVDLPREDYQNKTCYAIIWTSEDWEFLCKWGYGEIMVTAYPRDGIVIPLDETSETPYEDLRKAIELALEEQIELDGQDDVIPPVEDEPPRPLEDLDPEVRKALDKLGECQFGVGAWAALVNNYTKEVPDELPIFTSGLDRQRIINELARNYEECRGMTEYPWLSAEYENKFLADTLGLDYLGRATQPRGNEASLMFEMTSGVTDEEKAEEAAEWAEWMCKDENLHLGLCGHEFSGINRGGYTGGAECQLAGQPASEGGSAAEERCPLKELAEHEAAQPTTKEIHEAIQDAICETYSYEYEYLAMDKRPEWIRYCYEQ